MKRDTIIKKIDVIKFEDGITVDTKVIFDFLDEASDFEDTINANADWSYNYLSFDYNDEEQKLEKKLKELDVIRLSPFYESHHERLKDDTDLIYSEYRYWLSDGYEKFKNDFYKLFD